MNGFFVNIEFGDLRRAIIVTRYRSLRRAAEALGVRQSTLSRSLRNLEDQVGVTLFERTNNGTRPTEAGLRFLTDAQRLVDEADALAIRLKAQALGRNGHLRIGVCTSLSAGNLRATLVEHRRHFPDVEMSLADGSRESLLSDLARSILDVAFVAGRSPHWDGKSLSVWSERAVAAVPESHPLARRENLRWEELQGETLLLPESGPGAEFCILVESRFGGEVAGRIRCHKVGLDRALTLVSAGWGIALVLDGATGVVIPGVTFHELRDQDGPTRLHFRACWRQENSNPALGPFLDILRERYPDLSGVP